MSTTQVVISGLAAITLIYLPSEDQNASWFAVEVLMWVAMPVLGLLMSYFSHILVRKYIFEHSNARRRIIVLTPYYITFCAFIMFFMTLTKNYMEFNENHASKVNPAQQYHINICWYLIPSIMFPFVTLICSRYYMLRRGRSLNKISIENFAKKFMNEKSSTRCPDFLAAICIWNNKPILDVYFDDEEIKEQEAGLAL